MTDQSNVTKLQKKLAGVFKESKMTKRYDVFAKKWLIGFWVGSTFKIIGYAD